MSLKVSLKMGFKDTLAPLQSHWSGLPSREKNLLRLTLSLLLVLAIWLLSVAPALRTLRSAEAQASAQAAQLQQMQALQAQAQTLQNQPPLSFDEALRTLTATTQQTLSTSAQLGVAGDRASVTLKNASPDALAQWLTQARLNARSVPTEARLVRAEAPGGAGWSGVLVMSLPAR